MVHEEGFQVERRVDGELVFRNLFGREIPYVAPPADVPDDPVESVRARNEAEESSSARTPPPRHGSGNTWTRATRSTSSILERGAPDDEESQTAGHQAHRDPLRHKEAKRRNIPTAEYQSVKAFRDTWRDRIHSYLTSLRDRLTVARDLLRLWVNRGQPLVEEVFGEGTASRSPLLFAIIATRSCDEVSRPAPPW